MFTISSIATKTPLESDHGGLSFFGRAEHPRYFTSYSRSLTVAELSQFELQNPSNAIPAY
jgi:hypothetical protein